MQTNFTPEQLADPGIAEANKILRSCVHCGFCTATCPTYQILGDELDSPRGRIYLIKDMLENDRPADAETVKHVDRCLSCLACMTTCPSGVHYMYLVDHARAHIEKTYRRPAADRGLRALLAALIPYPRRFRLALRAAALGRPFAGIMPDRLKAMLALAPRSLPPMSTLDAPGVKPAQGERKMRVALLAGCAQRAIAPQINDATIRLLTRLGVEVVVAEGAGCCGSLTHHMGKDAHGEARANIAAWRKAGVDAVVVNASGCGTTVKDYGYMLRDDPDWAEAAAEISGKALDISELLAKLDIDARAPEPLTVVYHAACSLQHGQKVTHAPKKLLRDAGFTVVEPKESHLCCGSAGTYNLLQPELAGALRNRKIGHIEAAGGDVVATGNIGCMTQIAGGTALPVAHTVEFLDWATGGPKPAALSQRGKAQ